MEHNLTDLRPNGTRADDFNAMYIRGQFKSDEYRDDGSRHVPNLS